MDDNNSWLIDGILFLIKMWYSEKQREKMEFINQYERVNGWKGTESQKREGMWLDLNEKNGSYGIIYCMGWDGMVWLVYGWDGMRSLARSIVWMVWMGSYIWMVYMDGMVSDRFISYRFVSYRIIQVRRDECILMIEYYYHPYHHCHSDYFLIILIIIHLVDIFLPPTVELSWIEKEN